jgi:hypothetical protein
MSGVTQQRPIHLGLDVHKDSISVAVLPWEQESAEVEKIFHDEASLRRAQGCPQHVHGRIVVVRAKQGSGPWTSGSSRAWPSFTPDPEQSRALYVSALGLPLQAAEGDDYLHSEDRGQALRNLAAAAGRAGVLRRRSVAPRPAGPAG